MTFVSWLIFGIPALGIIVFVHELGHFLAAKASGIGVEVFSLGWGKRLWGFTRGSTVYQIAWFPIGGYCKMKGEMLRGDMSAESAAAMRAEPGSFLAAPPWRRIVVAVAGPASNFVFAVLVLTLIWWLGFRIHSTDSRIVLASQYYPTLAGSPADKAGLETGDRVLAIDGRPIQSFWEISETVRRSPGRALALTVDRAGGRIALRIVPERDAETRLGRIGVYAWVEPRVGHVDPGSPSDRAGLQAGDLITAVNDKPVPYDVAFYAVLEEHFAAGAQPATIAYHRGGEQRTTTLDRGGAAAGAIDIGLTFAQKVYRSPRLGLGDALVTGVQRTGEIVSMSVAGLRQLLHMQNRRLDDVVAGPIRITRMVGEATVSGFRLGVGEGFVAFFQFVALLSIAIAIMNLLPLPALDGGLIVISAAEAVSRRQLGPRLLWRFQIIGTIVVFGLIFLAVASDILSMGRTP